MTNPFKQVLCSLIKYLCLVILILKTIKLKILTIVYVFKNYYIGVHYSSYMYQYAVNIHAYEVIYNTNK